MNHCKSYRSPLLFDGLIAQLLPSRHRPTQAQQWGFARVIFSWTLVLMPGQSPPSASTSMPLFRLFKHSAQRHRIDLQKALHVAGQIILCEILKLNSQT
jgi:hypothetical protein